jgi:hypothetical protein
MRLLWARPCFFPVPCRACRRRTPARPPASALPLPPPPAPLSRPLPSPAPPPLKQVLLLDEITVDLDVLGRADLMAFLAEECEARGAAIVYATHIFDGLEAWPTHVAYVARGEPQPGRRRREGAPAGAGRGLGPRRLIRGGRGRAAGRLPARFRGCAKARPPGCVAHTQPPPPPPGRLQFLSPASELPHLREGRLLEMVAALLRGERDLLRKAGLERSVEYDPSKEGAVGAFSYAFNNGWVPGTLATSLAHGSNAVMRG